MVKIDQHERGCSKKRRSRWFMSWSHRNVHCACGFVLMRANQLPQYLSARLAPSHSTSRQCDFSSSWPFFRMHRRDSARDLRSAVCGTFARLKEGEIESLFVVRSAASTVDYLTILPFSVSTSRVCVQAMALDGSRAVLVRYEGEKLWLWEAAVVRNGRR